VIDLAKIKDNSLQTAPDGEPLVESINEILLLEKQEESEKIIA